MHPITAVGCKPAAWLPRLSRAPSQLAHRDRLNVTAPPLRLSGGSPDSGSGGAKEAWVWSATAASRQCSSNPEQKAILELFGAQRFIGAKASAYAKIEQVGRQIGKIR